MIEINFKCEEQTVVQVAHEFASALTTSETLNTQKEAKLDELITKQKINDMECEKSVQIAKSLGDTIKEMLPDVMKFLFGMIREKNFNALVNNPDIKKYIHVVSKSDTAEADDEPETEEPEDDEPEGKDLSPENKTE